jgi:general transcription factor 3C protein 4
VTGLNYVANKDMLIVTLADGSFYVVQNLSSSPSWSEDIINSQQLSKVARSVFAEIQDGNIDSIDMNRITGATLLDGASELVWAQE